MFDMVDSDGRPISAEYARTRMRWEPVVEVLQIKGNSETHPFLSPEDEFANFELWGPWLFGAERAQPLPANYVRTGLLRGLQLEEEVGVNPYKLGFQGASDTHATLSDASDEELYGGWNIEFAGPEAAPETLMSFRGDPSGRRHVGRGGPGDHGGVGEREHARGSDRGVQAQGGLRDERPKDTAADVRRLRVRSRGCQRSRHRGRGVWRWRTDGRGPRPGAQRRSRVLVDSRRKGPRACESGSGTGDQGLARQRRRDPRTRVRRGVGGGAHCREREGAVDRQHG